MNILVTGSSGFLGTSLSAFLERSGHAVVRLNSTNCDLTIADNLNRFNEPLFEQIYHLAAWTRAGDFCLRHSGEQWIVNQQINTNVLAWWYRRQAQAKLVCIGTSCAFDPRVPLVEENYLVGEPIDSLYTYAMTKRMLYAGLLALHRQYGLNFLHVVPSTLYGPGYHVDGRQMHFIFDLIRKIVRAHATGEPVVLWGDGHQSREVVYVDDFVRRTVALAGSLDNETVNIGSGREFTIRAFSQMICNFIGFDADSIRYDTTRYVGASSKCLIVDKLRRLQPDIVDMSLSDGLAKTIEWYSGATKGGSQ